RPHHVGAVRDQGDRREGLAYDRPGGGETRMQRERRDVVGRYPGGLGGLLAGPHGERLGGLADQGLVAPAAVIIVEQAVNVNHTRRRAALLGGLPYRRLGRRLVAVPRPARRPPGAAVMAPPGPPDEQNERPPGTVRCPDQQPGRAVPSPVPVVLVAADPAVAIALRHFSR